MSEKSDTTMEMAVPPEAKSLNPNDTDDKKKKSTLQYFLQLLADSVVTGVPQIVTVSNLLRKVFKILILGICIGGFIYQAVVFMNLYNTHPSSLEIEVKYSRYLPAPSVTICNRNPVQRVPFCKERKELCAKPTNLTRFCNMYPHHCNENTTVNDLEFVISDGYINLEDIGRFGQEVEDLLAECCYYFLPFADQCRKGSKQILYADENNMERNCYVINFAKFQYDGFEDFSMEKAFEAGRNSCLWWSPLALEQTYAVMVNLDPDEVFRPDMKPSAQAVVHSANDLRNPFQKGFRMEEGKQYTVTMRAFEEQLLPAPYSTNCTKNEDLDEDYNREDCIFDCTINFFIQNCGCTPISLLTTEVPTCNDDRGATCISSYGGGESCFLQCPRLCHTFYFEYEVTSSIFEDTVKPIDLGDGPIHKDGLDKNSTQLIADWMKLNRKGKTFLRVVYSKKEATIYKYKPKYEILIPQQSSATMEMSEIPEGKPLNQMVTDTRVKKSKQVINSFLDLLSNSAVTGLPQIVTVSSVVRRIFKIIVLGACFGCFIYQAIKFLELYSTYPSSLEIELTYTKNLPDPAVTICNKNPIQKTQYCKDFPERCAKPTNLTSFCDEYPYYCDHNTTLDDLQFIVNDKSLFDEDIMEKYQQQVKDFITTCCVNLLGVTTSCCI